jgi:hypothetical protein
MWRHVLRKKGINVSEESTVFVFYHENEGSRLSFYQTTRSHILEDGTVNMHERDWEFRHHDSVYIGTYIELVMA